MSSWTHKYWFNYDSCPESNMGLAEGYASTKNKDLGTVRQVVAY